MQFTTIHDVQRGIHRLLQAPRDVAVKNPVEWKDPPATLHAATSRHQELFADYKEFLEEALEIAEEWWNDQIQVQLDDGLAPDAALNAVYANVFAGPAARPEVVWTLRTYWLKCDAINRETAVEEQVPPQVFLLSWLMDGSHDAWVQALTGLPYWPIGLSDSGQWA